MSKPDLVLLHGWGMNPGVWRSVADCLAEDFALHMPPLPGYGPDNGEPAGALVDQAQHLLNQAPRKAVWLGWSLGGMIALQAALMAPERISTLLLVAATPRFVAGDDWPHGTKAATMQRFCAELQQDYPRASTRFLLLQAGQVNGARALARHIGGEVAAWGRVTPSVLDQGLRLLEAVDLRAELGRVSVPTRILHGELDRVTPPAAGLYLAQHIGDADCELCHAGHAPFVSLPDRFVDWVRGA